MGSRSSSSDEPSFLPVGRVAGHRGRGGELTVRTPGDSASWKALCRVRLEGPGVGARDYEVESSRAYRDRLVLKLKGVDDANAAAGLRGARVSVRWEEAPRLPAGVHWVAALVGLEVVDGEGRPVGRVAGVVAAGDADVLRVRTVGGDAGESDGEGDEELLIPLAPPFLKEIDEPRGRIVVDVPAELRELNRRKGP